MADAVTVEIETAFQIVAGGAGKSRKEARCKNSGMATPVAERSGGE